MAVDRDGRLAAEPLDDAPDERRELGWDRIADGVRDVEGRRARLDDRLVDLEQELGIRPRGVFRAELDLDVPAELAAAVGDPLHGLGERLLAVHPQLVLQVDVARRDEDVQVRPLGDLDRLDGALRVAVATARERGDRDSALRVLRDPAHGLEIAVGGGRKARLDHVDAEAHELARDLELLGGGQARAGRLLPVPERRIEDADAVRRGERPGGPRD